MKHKWFTKAALKAARFAALAATSAFSASTAKADTTDGTTAETELVNYVTLDLDFGSNVSEADITAAKVKYDGKKYETCEAANVAYMALFGVTWEKGYLDKTDNAAPLANYTGTPGSVSEVRYYVHGAVSGFTSLESASNNKDSTIGGNHQIFRTSYSVIGVNGTDGSKAKITSGGIQAYVAGGYETFFTKSGKLTVDNIEFTTTTVSTMVGASAARGTADDTKNEVTAAEMEIKNCTFRGPLYVYDNFDNEGKMTYNIHDCVLAAAEGVSTSAYAILAQCKGGNNLVIKDNKISGYPRGVNIENANINATIEGNEISVTDEGRSCIQLTLLAKADITGNTLNLTGGNALTLHEKLATLTTAAEVTISANKVTGNGYLIYDDANAEGKELTASTLNLTLAADNEIAATVDTTKGTKGGKTFEMSAIVSAAIKSDPRTLGYADASGTLAALPEGPEVKGDVWNVTAANAQYVLDGAYGSIDGKTINFTESIADKLILGRATKYAGSGTVYRHGSFDGDAMSYADFVAYKSQSGWTEYSYYERTVENVTFTAEKGVTIAGFNAEGGNHVYGTTAKPLYDCVRDTSTKDTNNGYYKRATLKDFTFKGLTFTANAHIETSNEATVFDGFTFTGCTFNIGGTTYSSSSDYQAIRYYSEANSGNVKNLVVEGCTFNECFQGVYAMYVNGVTVTDCTFTTMGHNAIAVQSGVHGACDFGKVVITCNTFAELNDRAIRFGEVGANTQLTIKNNVVISTSSTEECMKASGGEDFADGVTWDVDYNDWGTYLPAAPAVLNDATMVAQIGETKYSTLSAALNAATSGQTVKLIADIVDEHGGTFVFDMAGVTLDLNGHSYSQYNLAHIFLGTGGVIKNGKMVCLDGGSYALFIGDDDETKSFTVENVEMEGGINIYNATGVVLKELTVKAQNYYAVWLEYGSEATVESGTYASAEVAKGDGSLFNVALEMYGGVQYKSALTLAGGTFNTIGNSLMGNSGGTLVVTGGKFDADVATTYLAEDLTTYKGTDNLYAVKSTASEVVTVKIEETTESSEAEKTVQVALPSDVITEALAKAGITETGDQKATDQQKIDALSAKADNGNPVWVNIVAGIDSDKSVAVDAAQNADAATIEIAVPQINAEQAAAGFSIAYEVDEVSLATSDGKETATEVKKGAVASAPAINIDDVETSAYFQVKVVLRQNGSTVATVPATNYIGVLKKTTKMTKTIVPVPWHSLADGGDISVSNVVKTANLTQDDKLSVYDTANKRYNVYTLKEDKTWEPAAVYVIDANGQVSEESSGKPETMLVPRGSGVWLERSNTDTPIVTYGLASTEKQETQIAPAATATDGTTTPTWSLAAVPSTEEMSLADLAAPTDAKDDAVIVPTEGAPMVYTVEDGKWGYDAAVKVTDANGNATGIIKIERKTDATLPAGTGFWYVNGGGEKKVNW